MSSDLSSAYFYKSAGDNASCRDCVSVAQGDYAVDGIEFPATIQVPDSPPLKFLGQGTSSDPHSTQCLLSTRVSTFMR